MPNTETVTTGSFSHTLQQIDSAVSDVNNARGDAVSLAAAIDAAAAAATAGLVSMADVFGNVTGSDYQLAVGDDLNNILTAGNFTAASTTIAGGVYNSPWNATRYKVISLIITGSDATNCRGVQLLFPNIYPTMTDYPGVIFFLRYRHNATFTPWVKIGGTEVSIVTPAPQQN